MRKIIPVAEMSEIDRLTTARYSLPGLLLMEAAANSAARAIARRLPKPAPQLRALILCGRGNNGGDGAALARLLWIAGASVEVWLFGKVETTKGDARINFESLKRLAESEGELGGQSRLSFFEQPASAGWEETLRRDRDVIIDALFGTGLTRPLEGTFREIVSRLAELGETRAGDDCPRPLIVSLDLPSGLNADAAEPLGEAVRADLTVTFTAPKPANVLPPASRYNGELVVADIGSPPVLLYESPSQLYLFEATDARAWLRRTRYMPGSYKNRHGHALIIAGSRGLTGAAVLCAEAAMRSGAGLVTIATPASALVPVASRVMPEVMAAALPETDDGAINNDASVRAKQLSERADAVAVGPGLTSVREETRQFVRAFVEGRTRPLVIDADGLNSLAPWPSELRGSPELPLVLTPHIGEMRRLLGAEDDQDALPDRVGAARAFAMTHRLILVLKGERTLVAAPDGRVFINPTGNAGLGTAGSGDTLTGLITGFLAQDRAALRERADALAAVLAAVYVGGLAGDLAAAGRGMRAMVASDIREHLPAAVRALDAEGERPC